MGCGDSTGAGAAQAPEGRLTTTRQAQKLQVYGDYFSSDTRAILAILKHANIEHEFHLTNTLAQENMTPEY